MPAPIGALAFALLLLVIAVAAAVRDDTYYR
jgi:hypothetical protein